jgi:hypothetical protein
MENTARLYNCARCHRQVVICSDCDRGNIYCHGGCAEMARRASLRAAGQRYQQTRQGRLTHAQRQHRYRARRQKVTHQGSPQPPPNDPLPTDLETPDGRPGADSKPMPRLHCHFCGGECGPFLRNGPLRRPAMAGDLGSITPHWPVGAHARPP